MDSPERSLCQPSTRPRLAEIAPRLAAARVAEEQRMWRGVSVCSTNFGYHVYGAGPCFDTLAQASRYRDVHFPEEASNA